MMIASLFTLSHKDLITLRITDPYSIHRIVYDLFEDIRNEEEKNSSMPSGILFVDKGMKNDERKILILSHRAPKQPTHGTLTSKTISNDFLSSQKYRFEIVINPSKRDSKTGKTIGIWGQEAIAEWFTSKAIQSWGFTVHADSLVVEDMRKVSFNKGNQQVTHYSAKLTGELQVIDKEQFVTSFKHGIGRARAFGYGLLQIQPFKN